MKLTRVTSKVVEQGVKATVFIPTYNGEKYIGKILKAVFNQVIDFGYEVLIIDSGSTDKTLQIIKEYQGDHKNLSLEEIPNSEFGHGKTRNYAAHQAKGEIVVYLSHDAIPSHNRWLYEITKPFGLNDKIMGVTGKQIPRHKCVPLLKYEIKNAFRNLGPDFGTTMFYKDDFMKNPVYNDGVGFYSDVNSATRRDFLVNTIPYRDVPYAEDQLFGRDLIEAGYYKAYAPRASVIHSNDLLLREYKHRIFDEMVGLRRIGVKIRIPSVKSIIKSVVIGVIKDGVRTVFDEHYSFKRKVYWLTINPLYHIAKWRGVRLAAKADIKDGDLIKKHSLESKRKK
ncbi:MAG TPA: glycosyltransferase family A protein [Candidatus Saccharibacteria bacterium]|nr:glycosyltransferase family A protein [Candidatus Saccharibacteria bacterium]HRQ97736.1 glycosyltransferase family A protein [Candidatus Saccharibacteria bacterium]